MVEKVKELYKICFGTKADRQRTINNIYYTMVNDNMDLKKAFKFVILPQCDLMSKVIGSVEKYFLIEKAFNGAEKYLRKVISAM